MDLEDTVIHKKNWVDYTQESALVNSELNRRVVCHGVS